MILDNYSENRVNLRRRIELKFAAWCSLFVAVLILVQWIFFIVAGIRRNRETHFRIAGSLGTDSTGCLGFPVWPIRRHGFSGRRFNRDLSP